MNFKSVIIIMDADAPSNPAIVVVQDTNGEQVSYGDQIEVIDTFMEMGWTIGGVGNFQIGNGVYQNVLLVPAI